MSGTNARDGNDEETTAELPESVDRAALGRVRTVARILDESVRVPGTGLRIGLDPVLGALPVAGDLLTGALSLYVVFESARLGASRTTLVRMLANVLLDVVGGSVPVVGDVFDAVWKANTRNVDLLVRDLSNEQ